MKKKVFYGFLALLTVATVSCFGDTVTKNVQADTKTIVKEVAEDVTAEEIVEEIPEVIEESGIKLNIDNLKKDYTLNEELDLSGLSVLLVYSNSDEEVLSADKYTVSEVDMSTYGTKEIVVSYGEFSQSFNVEVSFIVTDVEPKTMYSKTSLNIRKGPSTDFEKIDCYSVNDEVKITGTCDNGWSRVDYKGKEGYVSTKYLSDKKIEIIPKASSVNYQDTAAVAGEIASRPGMIGRLTIPSAGVNVALFNSYSQATVDNKDSAGTYRYNGGQMVIADHKNQGFSAMKSSIPGKTIAYINNGKTVQAYICTTNNVGQNTANGIPYDLLDCNGNSIYLQNAGGFCMYTCNSHWSSITYTYWQPI